MKSITSFFTSAGKKPSDAIHEKSPENTAPPSVSLVQVDQVSTDTSVACMGRADGAYALLAKNAVAGDEGGVGSIASRSEIAKVLFSYKYGGSALGQEHIIPSQRNTHTSITKFSEEELAILRQELLSRRRWFVENGSDGGMRIIRSATCTRHFVPDGKYSCEQCCALDKDKSLQRQLRRVSDCYSWPVLKIMNENNNRFRDETKQMHSFRRKI